VRAPSDVELRMRNLTLNLLILRSLKLELRAVVRCLVVVAMMSGAGLGVGLGQGAAANGSGPIPIVFVHGNGDDSAKWIGIIGLFESNGYPADRLYAIRFTNPQARTDDTKAEAFRSSTVDSASELSGLVTRVLLETHSQKVALVGSSRGGMTMRNYLEHGGAANVAYAVTCGTPNHGVTAMDSNLGGEFNGKGPYLQGLNHGGEAGGEVVAGVKMMTLRSDSLDKYAQPTGIGLGAPQIATGVTFEGPALRGAENVVLAGLDHRELAFQPRAFAEMYRFIVGRAPKVLTVTEEDAPVISGLVTGFAVQAATNQGLAGVRLKVIAIGKGDATVYETTTGADGHWGPFTGVRGQEYEFELEHEGREVRYYKAAIARSTALLNLRFMPVPHESIGLTAGAEYVLVARPQAYFSRDRDPVTIAGKAAPEEPAGLPLRDSFFAEVSSAAEVPVRLRQETIVVRGSKDLAKDLPVADFLW
jgi:triacylglycerol lipase